MTNKGNDIAVIGISCRFPSCANLGEYWNNLIQGKELITQFNQKDIDRLYVNKNLINDPNYVPACGFLENIDKFDHEFFKISPFEAAAIDPQHRLFIEEAYHALEDAGYAVHRKDQRIGIYAGSGSSNYFYNLIKNGYLDKLPPSKSLLYSLGNEKEFLALRTAYLLNLTGPVLSVNSSSATGLAVIVKACETLANNDADIMIAGAASVILPNEIGYVYEPDNILSPDGHCRPFDMRSSGTVLSAGVGVVVLKRLDAAIADNDFIYSVIKGYSITNDGNEKIGFTAPSIEKQAACIESAFEMANINFNHLKFIETHGTGTTLGDPIEIAALMRGIKKWLNHNQKHCLLGAVKANLGHAQAAASMASFIKLVLTIKNKTITPCIHYTKPNPRLNIEQTPFHFNQEAQEWNEDMRVGSVNALGMGGVNCHVVVQNYGNEILAARNSPALFQFNKYSHWALEQKNHTNYPSHVNNYEKILHDQLYDIFLKNLNLSELKLSKDFNSLGISSLSALAILTDIEHQLKVRLSLDDFFKNGNFNSLLLNIVALQNSYEKTTKVVSLTSKKTGKNLFIIHPGNGEIYHYEKLSILLNGNINVIGISNSILNNEEENYSNIGEMAKSYIQLIKSIQPTGPYLLAGWSFGGVIAFEISCQLEKEKQHVEHIFLIDSWTKYSSIIKDKQEFIKMYKNENSQKWADALWKRTQLLFEYQPEIVNIPITLFKAKNVSYEYKEKDAFDNHWQRFCINKIDVHLIDGNHETILDEPGVNIISSLIVSTINNKFNIGGDYGNN